MRRETRMIGWFALLLGFTGILTAASIFANGPAQPEGLSCKALCGLTRLATVVFGDLAGTLVGGLLWLAVGALFCVVGYRVLWK